MLLPFLKDREAAGETIRVGVIGCGQMGEGLTAQMELMHAMEASVVADIVPGLAAKALLAAGVDKSSIVETDDPDVAAAALDADKRVATTNASIATTTAAIDIACEVTGITEVGARVVLEAIEAGKHVMQMNVETDATVGYLLRKLAKDAGVVYTLTGGDEPGATVLLHDFATSLGFDVVAAGKGKNNPLDRAANPDTCAARAKRQQMNPKMLASFVDGTKTMAEMTTLANAIGFVPDVRGMRGPEVTPQNMAEVYIPTEFGGIESRPGVVDFGIGIAPGVFVVFTTDHPKLARDLDYLLLGPGPFWSLYRPYHLTSLETPFWMARAVIFGETTAATDNPPTAETITIAKKDLRTGEVIDDFGGFSAYGLIEKADIASAENLLPMGLAPGAVLKRDIPLGQPLTYDDVELDEESTIVKLRRRQDAELA
ncbi:MAG: hypothetical protein HKN93_00355 [Acidimicrobiia bacterium]|nr:hypothetical protein [Acidimicrobiia bacterium]